MDLLGRRWRERFACRRAAALQSLLEEVACARGGGQASPLFGEGRVGRDGPFAGRRDVHENFDRPFLLVGDPVEETGYWIVVGVPRTPRARRSTRTWRRSAPGITGDRSMTASMTCSWRQARGTIQAGSLRKSAAAATSSNSRSGTSLIRAATSRTSRATRTAAVEPLDREVPDRACTGEAVEIDRTLYPSRGLRDEVFRGVVAQSDRLQEASQERSCRDRTW